MTVKINTGPGMSEPEWVAGEDFDASFRVVSAYAPGTDSIVTRFDVLMNAEVIPGRPFPLRGDQFNAGIVTSAPGKSDLMTPGAGVAGAYSFKASRQDLCDALRGLADAIESVPKKTVRAA